MDARDETDGGRPLDRPDTGDERTTTGTHGAGQPGVIPPSEVPEPGEGSER